MAVTVTIIIASLFCFLTVCFCRRYVKKTFDSIDQILDSVLARNAESSLEAAADNRISKLTHKAVKIIQMNTLDISQTTREKEIIQSFISDMSHQMKTPLSGVAMYTDLLPVSNKPLPTASAPYTGWRPKGTFLFRLLILKILRCCMKRPQHRQGLGWR